jgi:hypothetical protein
VLRHPGCRSAYLAHRGANKRVAGSALHLKTATDPELAPPHERRRGAGRGDDGKRGARPISWNRQVITAVTVSPAATVALPRPFKLSHAPSVAQVRAEVCQEWGPTFAGAASALKLGHALCHQILSKACAGIRSPWSREPTPHNGHDLRGSRGSADPDVRWYP